MTLRGKNEWLTDLLKAADAFRVVMIENGKVGAREEFDKLRALECALNPMNYHIGDQPGDYTAQSLLDATDGENAFQKGTSDD